MNIETYGTGERLRCAARLSAALEPKHLVLLPVPSTKDGVTVHGTDIPLDSTLVNLSCGSAVVGYGLGESYARAVSERGARLLDLSLDGGFLKRNADITATGAVGYILTSTKATPDRLSFGIVGYGRIGSALARLLLFLGGRVRIYTSRPSMCAMLAECGADSAPASEIYDNVCDFSDIDILINTAPKDMSAAFCGGKLPRGLRVLELASGRNFVGVSGVEMLPALPERMYPEAAGEAYFAAVKNFLSECGEADGMRGAV